MEISSASQAGAGPGVGETQRLLLLALKRLGPTTQSQIGREVDIAPATLREHLQALTTHGLVRRMGTRRGRRGRPEIVYALTARGEDLFPHRESSLLRELVTYLSEQGQSDTLKEFFTARCAMRLTAALARVGTRTGAERFVEVARILSEEGFMALVGGTPARPTLRLCHCPIRDLVAVTRLPCRFEQTLITELLGRPLYRTEYIPDGQASCSYIECAPTSAQESP